MMRRTGKKRQSLVMKLVLCPMRILKRVRQLYMKGLQDCAGEIGYGGISTFPISQHPPPPPHLIFLDVKPLRARFGGGTDTATIEQQIPRKIHISNMNNIIADDENQTRQLKQPWVKHNRMVRKMTRIDEDQPCNFEEEDQIDMKITTRNMVFYPRRSYFH